MNDDLDGLLGDIRARGRGVKISIVPVDGSQPFVVADSVAAATIVGLSDPETFSKAPA
ncbi:hypothetical protein NKI39_31015 [Mesorhizobium sp. M0664]|uniref:hypothetical protein n=1 Tax=Mesorhizobium sp. M0664 TaxID=2956982 RepID=UPI00333A5523